MNDEVSRRKILPFGWANKEMWDFTGVEELRREMEETAALAEEVVGVLRKSSRWVVLLGTDPDRMSEVLYLVQTLRQGLHKNWSDGIKSRTDRGRTLDFLSDESNEEFLQEVLRLLEADGSRSSIS